jgi:PBSX family phage terminase large subunit
MYQVEFECDWDELINDRFIPLLDNRDRYLILWGSRGSSKSDFTAKKLIWRCITEKYFRYILIRNNYNSIKDSSYQTIKDLIIDLGLESLFEFKLQPLEIVCVNGNKFIARGCDDTNKLKSIKDPTGAWYEEDIPEEDDFIKITTSIRTTKADYLQEIFTINPQVEGEYREHWFWKRFFGKHDPEINFSDSTYIKVENETVELKYTVHHSTYADNKWLSLEFKAWLLNLKESNPYMYEVFCKGLWANRIAKGLFYMNYQSGRNSGPTRYYPSLPLHISFDFNRNPYMTCSIWQVHGKKAELIDEIAVKYPDSSTRNTCREFKKRYASHTSGLFIYGDPSGKNEGTTTEAGENNYTIIEQELAQFRPKMRVANVHPSVSTRGDFINEIFRAGFAGIEIVIGEECGYMKRDLTSVQMDSDGTKFKQKKKDKESGITSEAVGHFSDSLDYFICECFSKEYNQYQKGSNPPKVTYGFREDNLSHGW